MTNRPPADIPAMLRARRIALLSQRLAEREAAQVAARLRGDADTARAWARKVYAARAELRELRGIEGREVMRRRDAATVARDAADAARAALGDFA